MTEVRICSMELAAIVLKYAVPCCKIEYNSWNAETTSEKKIPVYKFSKDAKLGNIWIKAIH